MTKSRGINRRRHLWTRSELRILRRDYPHKPTHEIASALGMRRAQVSSQAMNLGMRKSAAYLASPSACRLRRGDNVGAAYRFQKGHVPANKGLRRPGWAPGRMRETQFKKGVLSPRCAETYKPIGSEHLSADGYLVRKFTDEGRGGQRWRAVHRILWEEAHGPIPPGHVVAFKDGDKANLKVGNLELITMEENSIRNSIWRKYPKELARVLQLRGAVQRQINRRLGRYQEKNRERRKTTRRTIRNARRATEQGRSDGHRAGEGRRPGR